MSAKQSLIKQIPFQNLKLWEGNMRKASTQKQSDNELYASIKSQNLLKNLIVFLDDDGKYGVAGGGRRYRAVAKLISEGHFDSSYTVPCKIVDKESAHLATIHENIHDEPHPADLYTAYKNLADQNHSVKQIATMFGKTQKEVEKMLTLARVHDELLSLFRQNKIDLPAMIAFTVTTDQEKQLACWSALKKNKPSASQIRQYLTKAYYESTDPIARVVGVDRYKAAGGELSKDIFQDTVYFHDMELVESLAQTIINEKLDAIKAEGWKWVEYDESFSGWRRDLTKLHADFVGVPKSLIKSIENLENKIEESEEAEDYSDEGIKAHEKLESDLGTLLQQKEEYRNFTQDVIKTTGAILTLDEHGFSVYRALLRHEDAAKAKNLTEPNNSPEESTTAESQALLADLAAYNNLSFQACMVTNPGLCFDIFVYELATKVFTSFSRTLIQFSMNGTKPSGVEIEDTEAFRKLADFKNSLQLDWVELEGEASLNEFCKLAQESKLKLLAYCVAINSRADIANITESQSYIANSTGYSISDYWKPTAGNYFNRLNKAALVEIGKSFYDESWEELAIRKKKSEVAQELANADQLKNWLPRQFDNAPSIPLDE